MKIAVDARSLTFRPTGIGQLLLAAVNIWATAQPDKHFYLLAHKPIHPQAQALLQQLPNIEYLCVPSSILPTNGFYWLLNQFTKVALSLQCTYIWGASGVLPLNKNPKLTYILTVADLVYKDIPESMAWKTRVVYTSLVGRSIKQADILWAISDYTRQRIVHYFPTVKADDILVACGLNPLRVPLKLDEQQYSTIKEKYNITPKTLLFVGTLEPRKNLSFLLNLMPQLAPQGFNLIIVGCSGWGKSNIASLIQSPNYPINSVIFTDYIDDAELQALYQTVAFFISTSVLEGFGLPQLEAMTLGCPVICAANSAMIEVVGDGGVLVESWKQAIWIEAINHALMERNVLAERAKLRHLALNFDAVLAKFKAL